MDVRFTQDSIQGQTFKDGKRLEDLVDALVRGEIGVLEADFLVLEATRYKSDYFCNNNRRLWCLQQYQQLCPPGETVRVRLTVARVKDPIIMRFMRQFTTNNNGLSVEKRTEFWKRPFLGDRVDRGRPKRRRLEPPLPPPLPPPPDAWDPPPLPPREGRDLSWRDSDASEVAAQAPASALTPCAPTSPPPWHPPAGVPAVCPFAEVGRRGGSPPGVEDYVAYGPAALQGMEVREDP